jgi:cytochrome c-type biogenesis protein CcmF
MEFIVLKAIIFPYINILWTGSILMLLGFVISFIRRVRKKKA